MNIFAWKYSNNFLFRNLPTLLSLLLVVVGLAAVTFAIKKPQRLSSLANDVPLVTIEGIYQVIHSDDFENKKSETNYRLKTATGEVKLDGPLDRTIKPGSRVKIQYRQTDSSVETPAGLAGANIQKVEKVDSPETAAAESIGIGDKKIAAVIVNFLDAKVDHPTVDEARTLLNSTINPLFYQDSFEKLRLTADVLGTVNLNQNMPGDCDAISIEDIVLHQVDPVLDFSNYQLLMIIIANPSGQQCPYTGKYLGGVYTDEGWISGVNIIVSEDFNQGVVSHELGHAVGGMHSNAWECGAVAVGGDCQSIIYGDLWEPLGAASSTQFGSAHKEMFDWTEDANAVIYNPDSPYPSYSYGISAINKKTPNAQMIKINLGHGVWYFIESRTKDGFNAGLPDAFVNGVIIYLETPILINTGDIHLIDTTPNSKPEGDDFSDAPLQVGESVTDIVTNVKITLERKDASGYAVVKISKANLDCLPRPLISASAPSSVRWGETYTLSCDWGQANIGCAYAVLNDGSCSLSGWNNTAAQFSCAIYKAGKFNNFCQLIGTQTDYGDSVYSYDDSSCIRYSDVHSDVGRFGDLILDKNLIPLENPLLFPMWVYDRRRNCLSEGGNMMLYLSKPQDTSFHVMGVDFFDLSRGRGYVSLANDYIPKTGDKLAAYVRVANMRNEAFESRPKNFEVGTVARPETYLVSPANGERVGQSVALTAKTNFHTKTNTRKVYFNVWDLTAYTSVEGCTIQGSQLADDRNYSCTLRLTPGHNYQWSVTAYNEEFYRFSNIAQINTGSALILPEATGEGEGEGEGDEPEEEHEDWTFTVTANPTPTPVPTLPCTAIPQPSIMAPGNGFTLSNLQPTSLYSHVVFNCPQGNSANRAQILLKQDDWSGFQPVCDSSFRQPETDFNCEVNLNPGHRYEMKVRATNPLGQGESQTQKFSLAAGCDGGGGPQLALVSPQNNSVLPASTTGVSLRAYVSYKDCSGIRHREIWVKNVTKKERFSQLCWFDGDSRDNLFDCAKTGLEAGNTYAWYAVAKNNYQTPTTSQVSNFRVGISGNSPPKITTTKLANGKVGKSYQTAIEGYDFDVNDTFSLTIGGLPTGLAVGNCTAIPEPASFRTKISCPILGTAVKSGTYNLTLKLQDSNGGSNEVMLKLKIKGKSLLESLL